MGTALRRLAVRLDEAVWREAVRGFSRGPLEIATSARSDAERRGVALADVIPCEALGPDGTALAGCAKLYLPFRDSPPSERPFASSCSSRKRWTRRSCGLRRLRSPSPESRRAQRLRASTSPAAWPVPRAGPIVTAGVDRSTAGLRNEPHRPNRAELARPTPRTSWDRAVRGSPASEGTRGCRRLKKVGTTCGLRPLVSSSARSARCREEDAAVVEQERAVAGCVDRARTPRGHRGSRRHGTLDLKRT